METFRLLVVSTISKMLWASIVVFLFSFQVLKVYAAPGRFKINPTCRPPRGNVCVEIRKCPYFADLLDRSSIPRPRHVIKAIREFQCGFIGSTPKVCCTLTPKIAASAADSAAVAQFRPPSVLAHRNLGLLPTGTCGRIADDVRITSGTKTALMEFPWMALIAYYTDEGVDFKCGGTLINNQYVLTAAHCVANSTVVGIRLGEHDVAKGTDCDSRTGLCAPPVQDFYIEDIIVHPGYNKKTFADDIAMVRLATPANFTYENVRPICLPLGNNANMDLAGKFGVVSGWGVTESGYKSTELLKVSIPVIPNRECKILYRRHSPISHKQICAGGVLGRDSCGGDSGGPLKYVTRVNGESKYVQYGVVSYGPRHCGAEGQPGIYTNVVYYMDWILDHLKPSIDD